MTRDQILAALGLDQLTSVAAAVGLLVNVGTRIVSSDGSFGEIVGKYQNPYPAPEETPDTILMIMLYDACQVVPTRKSELTTFFLVP